MKTKNLLKSLKRRLSEMLCLVALLCITGRAYAYNQSNVTIYYDNSETKWSSCYFMQGKNNHASRVSMSRVSGTQYLWTCSTGSYDGAEGFRITKQSSGYTDGIWKACWGSDYESTYVDQSAASSNTIYTTNGYESRKTADCSAGKQEYNWGSTKTNTTYIVTISCGSGGSLTVKDFDDASVNNGASKNYLTVLKITASPNDGYKLKSLTYDGTSISSGDSKTLTKAVTIAAEFEQECVISAYSLGGFLNGADKKVYDSDASFAFVSQGDGTYKLTRSFTTTDNYFWVFDNCGNKYGVTTYTENNPATLVKDGNEKVGAKGLTTGENYNITWNPSTNQIGWSLACTDPTVTTAAASNIGTATATLGGSYTGGSATPTEVGIEWTSGTTGSIAASSVSSSFTVNATGLTAGTTYKYKAYAKACGGNKVYGSEQTFKTTCTATKPTVSTVAATGVGTNVATVGCNVTNAGVKADCSAETITARGIEWTQGKSGQESIGSETGSSTKQITGLTPGTEYKYMAFATNASGTSYGEENSFTTLGVHGDITGLPASPVAKCSGEELQLAPQCSTATSWSYSSDATGVATVSGTGLITAVGAGSAVITVTAKADNYIDKSVQITVNVSASPAVSASAINTTAYEVITLTSTSGSVLLWSKDAADTRAYFVKNQMAVDGNTVEAESVNFKAPAKVSAYTITAKNKNNDCTSNLSITISEPHEVCN